MPPTAPAVVRIEAEDPGELALEWASLGVPVAYGSTWVEIRVKTGRAHGG